MAVKDLAMVPDLGLNISLDNTPVCSQMTSS